MSSSIQPPGGASHGDLRPAQLCGELLAAVEASEGRRRRRARDTTPDAIGLGIKRELLEDIVRADPEPALFESWLVQRCLAAGTADGPVRAMALSIWDEWRLAATTDEFRRWLARGAPSDDREGSPRDRKVADERKAGDQRGDDQRGGERRAGERRADA